MKADGRPFRSFDVFVFTINSSIGFGLALLPFVSGEEIRSAWLKIATASIPCFLLIFLIYLFSKKYTNWDFFASLQENVWKPLYVLITFYIVATIIFGWIVILRTTAVIIQAYLLNNSPQLLIMFLALVATVPAVFYGIKAISRFIVAFLFVELFIFLVIISVIFTSEYFRWIYIPPMIPVDVFTYIKASISDITRYVGVFAVVAFLPFVKKDEPILMPMGLGLLFITSLYVLVSIAVIGTFGYDEALTLFSPIIALSHTFAGDFGVLERIDLFLLSFWIYIIYKMMIIHYWFIVSITSKSIPKVKEKWIIIFTFILILSLAIYLPDYSHIMWAYHNHNALIAMIILPSILLIFLLFKKRGKANVEQNYNG